MTAPPFKLLGLDHLLLHVRGMDVAERFYCGVLGCTVTARMPNSAMVELSPGVVLVDIEDPNGSWAAVNAVPGRNLDHFAILTDGWEQEAMRTWLVSHGVAIEDERSEETECSLYIRDPSGNLVELLKRVNRPATPRTL